MSAVVLDFQQAVRKRNGVATQRVVGLGVEDAITQAVMEHFKNQPISVVKAAIQSAQIKLATGGGFIAAMDAAARTVANLSATDQQGVIDERNQARIEQLQNRREIRTAALLDIAEQMIRAHWKGRHEVEITQALSRAFRVLMGGGSLCVAIFRAINVDADA